MVSSNGPEGGSGSQPELPLTGVVTILFTDLVGSTELLDRLGDDAGRGVLRAHFALLRDTVQQAGGREVKSLGDGLMVSFASPVQAAGCAVAMQRAIAEHNRAEPGRALPPAALASWGTAADQPAPAP